MQNFLIILPPSPPSGRVSPRTRVLDLLQNFYGTSIGRYLKIQHSEVENKTDLDLLHTTSEL